MGKSDKKGTEFVAWKDRPIWGSLVSLETHQEDKLDVGEQTAFMRKRSCHVPRPFHLDTRKETNDW